MPSPAHRLPAFRRVSIATVVVLIAAFTSPALGAPTVGFMEHWPVGLDGWTGGDVYSNPGTGGVHGAGDGFLVFSTPGPPPSSFTNLGAQSAGAEYAGNWQAAGITQVRFWLNDVGNTDPLEMHFGIGNSSLGNFWQYNPGFIPAHNAWTPFVVDLTSAAAFTHIIDMNGGTFNDALQNVNRILVRHDLAPYIQSPDQIVADVGLDELLLTDGTADAPLEGPGTPHPLAMAPPYPNPSRGPVALAIDTFADEPITIQVVDISGRVIRRAMLAPGTGLRLWTWDGTTDAGASAPAGVYRVRAFGPSGGVSRSLVRVGSTH